MHYMKAVAVACYQNVKVQPTILEKVCVITYHDFFKFTLFSGADQNDSWIPECTIAWMFLCGLVKVCGVKNVFFFFFKSYIF